MPHRTLRNAARILLLACLCALRAAPAHADEVSGTWTGLIEGRANYYYERSTRVVPPTARVTLEAPTGTRLTVGYLVDVIASASVAQTGGGSDKVFTELRHAGEGRVGQHFRLGDNELDLSAHLTYSIESDYRSWIYGLNGSFAWNDKDSTITLGLSRVADTVWDNSDATFHGNLSGLTSSVGFAQVLSPVLLFGLGYEFVYLEGYLGNPYRRALIGPLPHREDPPHQRYRHNLEASLSWFMPETNTTLQLYGRVYDDSWKVQAVSPEVRLYQMLGDDWVFRLRYRYYVQNRADFALPNGVGAYHVGYTGPITNDPKLTDFHDQQVGGRIEFALNKLRGTVFDGLKYAVLDVAFDYQWNTNAFGNNVIATAGGRLPF